MERGVVKWFNEVSDYGFIACDDSGPDRYVRGESIAGIAPALLAGTRVEFQGREGGMGPEAIDVHRLAPRPREPKRVAALSVWEGEGGATH